MKALIHRLLILLMLLPTAALAQEAVPPTYGANFQTAVVANGNGSVMSVGGLSGVVVQVAGGTFVATVNFEGSIDGGATWTAIQAINYTTGATATTEANTNGLYFVPVTGLKSLRCRLSGYTSGTITITGYGVPTAAALSLTTAATSGTSSVNLAQVAGNTVATFANGIAEFSFPTTSTGTQNLTVSVGNTATQLCNTNTTRRGLILVNNGTTAVYVGFNASVASGASAAANGGFILEPNGGSYTMVQNTWTGVVYGITASGSSVIGVQEW